MSDLNVFLANYPNLIIYQDNINILDEDKILIVENLLQRPMRNIYDRELVHKFVLFDKQIMGFLCKDKDIIGKLYQELVTMKYRVTSIIPAPTIKDKPSRYLVSYAYFETSDAKVNLEYFNKYGLLLPEKYGKVDYVLIVNGSNCSVKLSDKWTKIIHRENTGMDFGAWTTSLENADLDEYDYFVFINASIRGPFGDDNWLTTFSSYISDEVKLVGLSTNNNSRCNRVLKQESAFHIQSMLLITDMVGLKIIYPTCFPKEYKNKNEVITKSEIGSSLAITNNGYKIQSLLSDLNPYILRAVHPYEGKFIKTKWARNIKEVNQLSK